MTKSRKSYFVSILLYMGYINCISATCPECSDLVLIVDRSSSVGIQNWDTFIRPFLQQFGSNALWSLGPNANNYQVAVVTYGSEATLEWNLGSAQAQSAAMYGAGISSIPIPQFALTNLGAGLVTANQDILEHLTNRDSCGDVCIVLIHDEITKDTALFNSYVTTFQSACQKIIAVGVEAERPILEAIVTDPLNIVEFASYEELALGFPMVAEIICQQDTTTTNPPHTGYECATNSPCRPLVTPGLFYYPHIQQTMFVQCDMWGGCWDKPCAPGTIWRQELLTCDHAWKYP